MSVQIYLVGGAVRDALLGVPVHDKDYLVVGADAAYMLAAGFVQVGKDFPVFLHPQNHCEYALARLERKTGSAHGDFVTDSSASVTLEQDLARRDFTINAIAQDDKGGLHDPHGGVADIRQRVLRHIGSAFSEDPLRVLRLARFYASLGTEDAPFRVDEHTFQLAQQMVARGDLNHLSAERIWQECQRALASAAPWRFYQLLADLGAQKYVYIADDALLAQGLDWLQAAHQNLSAHQPHPAKIAFAALCVPLADNQIQQLCQKLRAPVAYMRAAQLASGAQRLWAMADEGKAAAILDLIQRHQGWQQHNGFALALADLALVHPQAADLLQRAHGAAQKISAQAVIASGARGKDIGSALAQQRLIAIQNVLKIENP